MTDVRPHKRASRTLDELLTPDEVSAILKGTKLWLSAQVQPDLAVPELSQHVTGQVQGAQERDDLREWSPRSAEDDQGPAGGVGPVVPEPEGALVERTKP
jgi:hypothetical protein